MKTDHRLQLDVLAELSWEPSVKAEDIGVKVDDGITLSGEVMREFQRQAAIGAVRSPDPVFCRRDTF